MPESTIVRRLLTTSVWEGCLFASGISVLPSGLVSKGSASYALRMDCVKYSRKLGEDGFFASAMCICKWEQQQRRH